MSVSIDAEGLSHPGRSRDSNDDQFLIAEIHKSLNVTRSTLPLDNQTRFSIPTGAHLYVVADGLGRSVEGTLANDRATFTAVQYILALLPWFFNAAGSPKDNTNDQLTRALRECELLLPAGGRDTIIGRRPVTTVTMAYLIWPDLFIIHLGDSRCYIRRGSDLHRVTSDQAELDQPRREGLREPKSALRSGLSTVVWQTFRGADEPVLPEVYHAMVAAGDTILLCTDGLSRHVSDDGIVALLSADGTAQAKCDNLIAAANGAGGTDNITVIVSQILDDHQSPIPGGNGSSDAATQESS